MFSPNVETEWLRACPVSVNAERQGDFSTRNETEQVAQRACMAPIGVRFYRNEFDDVVLLVGCARGHTRTDLKRWMLGDPAFGDTWRTRRAEPAVLPTAPPYYYGRTRADKMAWLARNGKAN